MNPLPTFLHNFQISNKLSFWDIHVYVLSLRCILCVFSCYCARFVIFDCVPVVYKKNPSLYKKDESFTNILHNFQISNMPSFWDIHVCILSLRCILCVFSCYCARFVIFDCVPVVYKKNPSLYKKDESFTNILHNFQISNMTSFWDIHVCILTLRCILCVFFMLLCSIRHFWLRSSCIQEKSFSIQERWILYQHSYIIFRSPTSLVSEIYTFMSCHYDVFCVFFHVIVLDSSFLTAF